MEGALSLAMEQARAAGAGKILSLRLRVGALSGVVPDALTFAFEALSAGTPAEGGQLIIEAVPAQFWCESCGRAFEADALNAICPACGKHSSDLRSGQELQVVSMEVE